MKWGDEGGDDVDSQDKDHDDHDDDEGRDASSNGGSRRRQKRTFASPLNSTGDNGIMIYLSCQNLSRMKIFMSLDKCQFSFSDA